MLSILLIIVISCTCEFKLIICRIWKCDWLFVCASWMIESMVECVHNMIGCAYVTHGMKVFKNGKLVNLNSFGERCLYY